MILNKSIDQNIMLLDHHLKLYIPNEILKNGDIESLTSRNILIIKINFHNLHSNYILEKYSERNLHTSK